MKILLTGLTGYIGKRLLPVLLENGHEVFSITRDRSRIENSIADLDNHHIIEVTSWTWKHFTASRKKSMSLITWYIP